MEVPYGGLSQRWRMCGFLKYREYQPAVFVMLVRETVRSTMIVGLVVGASCDAVYRENKCYEHVAVARAAACRRAPESSSDGFGKTAIRDRTTRLGRRSWHIETYIQTLQRLREMQTHRYTQTYTVTVTLWRCQLLCAAQRPHT